MVPKHLLALLENISMLSVAFFVKLYGYYTNWYNIIGVVVGGGGGGDVFFVYYSV